MSEPRRIQLSRKKGWRMPANTVNVARAERADHMADASASVTARNLHLREAATWRAAADIIRSTALTK